MPKHNHDKPGGKGVVQAAREYRKAQNARARANRERRAARVDAEWKQQLATIPGHPENDLQSS